MASYPKDRFDQLPEDLKRIGAHRGPKKRGGFWIGFAWSLLAIAVLVVGGVWGLGRFMGIDVGIPFLQTAPEATPTPTPTPTPTVEAWPDPTTIDPARNIKVVVLNGTATPGLQDTVGDALSAAGWTVDSRTVASASDVATTTVYYSDPLNEDVAKALVVSLGTGEIRLVAPDTFPGTALTTVLGLDYPGAVVAP